MSTAPSATSTLQADLQAVEQIGATVADPFIKSASGKATEQTVLGEVNLGIAAIPVFVDLFQSFTNLLSHLHKSATTPAAPAIPAAVQVTAITK